MSNQDFQNFSIHNAPGNPLDGQVPHGYSPVVLAEEPKRRGRPKRDPNVQAAEAPQKRKARKAEPETVEPPDDIQCIFRTLQAPDMEVFAKAYELLRPYEGRGRVLAVLNQVLS